MPVYNVILAAPNGNRVTRPIVAATPGEAISEMEAAHGIDNAEAEGFTIQADAICDPHREVETSLRRMNARNRERGW